MRAAAYQFWGAVSALIYLAATALLIVSAIWLIPAALRFMFDGPSNLGQFLLIYEFLMFSLIVIGGTIGLGILWVPVTLSVLRRTKADELNQYFLDSSDQPGIFFGTPLRMFGFVVATFAAIVLLYFAVREDTPGYDAPFSSSGEALLAEPLVRMTDSIDGYSIRYGHPERLSVEWSLVDVTPEKKARWDNTCINPKRKTTCEHFINQHGLPTTAFTRKHGSFYRTWWVVSLDDNSALWLRADDFEMVYRLALPHSKRSNVVEYIRISNEMGRKVVDSLRLDPATVQD